jgi:hypothetical protein
VYLVSPCSRTFQTIMLVYPISLSFTALLILIALGCGIDRPGDLLDFLFRCFGLAYFAAGLFYKKRGTTRWSLFRTACYYTFFSNPSAVKTAVSPSLISAAAKAASG